MYMCMYICICTCIITTKPAITLPTQVSLAKSITCQGSAPQRTLNDPYKSGFTCKQQKTCKGSRPSNLASNKYLESSYKEHQVTSSLAQATWNCFLFKAQAINNK